MVGLWLVKSGNGWFVLGNFLGVGAWGSAGALGLGWFWTIKTLHVKHCFWGSKLAFAARATGDHRLNEDLATSPVGGSIDPHAAAWLAWLKCQYLKIPLN